MKKVLQKGFQFLRMAARDDAGSVLPMIALVLAVSCGAAALIVDLSMGYQVKSQLRTIAEASALAAASQLPDEAEAMSAALDYANLNMPSDAYQGAVAQNNITFGSWDAANKEFVAGGSNTTAVRVVAHLGNVTSFFAKIFGVDKMEVNATVIATRDGSPICIAALDPSGDQALVLNSNATINVSGCELFVNSSAGEALYTDSNAAVIDADRVCVRGDTGQYSNSAISPSPENGCTGPTDPYADIPDPSFGGCDHNGASYDDETVTLSPGVYCGGLEIKNNANVTLLPGEYIIKDGEFFVDSNASVSGTEVGFFLTGSGAVLNVTSNTTLSLSAPSSGALEGMVFFQDRDDGGTHKFDSNGVANLSGAIYLPSGNLEMNSNSAITTPSSCTQIIAYRVMFDSNSGLDLSADFSQCPGDRANDAIGKLALRK